MLTCPKTARQLSVWLVIALIACSCQALAFAPKREFYQLKNDSQKEQRLEKFVQQAYLPALHRAGVGKVGVFKLMQTDSLLFNLMYMTSFENKAARDAHWKEFSADPAWKKLNAMPEYAHNFMRMDMYLLNPTAYSEI